MPEPTDLAIQLYTVRRSLAEDVDATLAELASIGFRRVEAYDLVAWADGLREAIPRHGLTIPASHVGLIGPASDADVDAAIGAAGELGVGLLIQPWTEPARWRSVDGIRSIADELNAVAARGAPSSIRVGYHNHQFELQAIHDGRHGLELLADLLAPEVVLEVDTYWAHAGGADVPALLGRLGERVVALHLKDGDGSLDPLRQVALGDGVVPVREVVAAAPDALRVVELDDTAGDLLTAVRASRAFLVGLADG